ncbi:hypothetical protein [Hyalangium sp.]|uniref:hypothetical protein n=1 Tax=Hyalangium sp. TaxID=2028555 RepID=UPI002D5393E7|nr:hypothetical protein [Hyalangium sp.]HYI02384.1 hypothetical protein [Hyalangium sp.]
MSIKNQDKHIERREGTSAGSSLMISSGQSLIELEPEQLRAVVGGAKNPKIEVTVKPDGTIVIKVN